MNFFLELKEGLSIAWDAIWANKMRSALTTLGIVIGIVTVTLMGTAIDGMNRAFHKSISIIGADTLYVNRTSWMIDSEAEWRRQIKRPEVTLLQAQTVERQFSMAKAISPVVAMNQMVRYNRRSAAAVQIVGSTDQFLITSGFSIADGRFFSPGESDGGRPVCVIGNDVATNLFVNEQALGKRIQIGTRSLEVIGILAKQGSFLGLASLDNQVVIPIQQLLIGYWRNPDFEVLVKVKNVEDLDEAKEELRGVMRKVRRLAPGAEDNFAINQQEQFVQTFNKIAGTIAAVGLLITGLSLFVGGIGIMNIMFVSVAERTREIGVRKAIGAKSRTILMQFLIEAAVICLLGGLFALAITYPLTLVMNRFLPSVLSLPVVGLAILISLVTGLVSGFLPAWRAARMDPVEALRNE